MTDDDKDLKDGEESTDEENASGDGEHDFSPVTTAAPVFDDPGDDIEADLHSTFDDHGHKAEDPHDDIYGDAGVPRGFGGDDEEEMEDEESDEYEDGDSDAY